MGATFARKAFAISRLAEFASVPELTKQLGQPPKNWPLVIGKELIDNAIDEAEEAGEEPKIEIAIKGDAIIVADKGPGIASETVWRKRPRVGR